MPVRLVTQADIDKHPELANQGVSVNQMYDFQDDPETPVSEAIDESASAKSTEPVKRSAGEKPVTKNDAEPINRVAAKKSGENQSGAKQVEAKKQATKQPEVKRKGK